jgi:flavin reductase (DIM6/NTAB) family NADH-FMN oxidoreductase RutF
MQAFAGTDDTAYKALARRWAATVTVVTTRSADSSEFDGLTATAFLTISINPPIVLVSISAQSQGLEAIKASKVFAVNLLAPDQVGHSGSFAQPKAQRTGLWESIETSPDANGVPLLNGAAGAFSASLREVIPMGDHVLVLGDVTEIHHGISEESLLYANRSYGKVVGL